MNYSWLVSDARFKQISFPQCDETTDEIKDWSYCLGLTKCNETFLDVNLSNPSTIISLELGVIRTGMDNPNGFLAISIVRVCLTPLYLKSNEKLPLDFYYEQLVSLVKGLFG